MYVVVRGDLSPGLQAAQAVHAGFLFATEYPEATREWHDTSQYVIVLQVPNLERLTERYARFPSSIPRVMFTEPDLGDAPTAFAALGHEAADLLSDLRLALAPTPCCDAAPFDIIFDAEEAMA